MSAIVTLTKDEIKAKNALDYRNLAHERGWLDVTPENQRELLRPIGDWSKAGRTVRKGEVGIKAPDAGYTLFHRSQTEEKKASAAKNSGETTASSTLRVHKTQPGLVQDCRLITGTFWLPKHMSLCVSCKMVDLAKNLLDLGLGDGVHDGACKAELAKLLGGL